MREDFIGDLFEHVREMSIVNLVQNANNCVRAYQMLASDRAATPLAKLGWGETIGMISHCHYGWSGEHVPLKLEANHSSLCSHIRKCVDRFFRMHCTTLHTIKKCITN